MEQKTKLSDLIAALQIFLKYGDIDFPTECRHETLHVSVVPGRVSAQDLASLEELGFNPVENSDDFEQGFISHRFGS